MWHATAKKTWRKERARGERFLWRAKKGRGDPAETLEAGRLFVWLLGCPSARIRSPSQPSARSDVDPMAFLCLLFI